MESSVKKPQKEEAKQDEEQTRDERGRCTSSIDPGMSPQHRSETIKYWFARTHQIESDEFVEVGSLTSSCTGSGNA